MIAKLGRLLGNVSHESLGTGICTSSVTLSPLNPWLDVPEMKVMKKLYEYLTATGNYRIESSQRSFHDSSLRGIAVTIND